MFKLIRRISYGVIPRSDRPWEEDRKFPVFDAPFPLFSWNTDAFFPIIHHVLRLFRIQLNN